MINERRGAPRYAAKAGELVMLPFPVNVQVIDISVAGVLLQSTRPIEVGTRGSLRLNIEGTPFHAIEAMVSATLGLSLYSRLAG